MKRPTPMRTRLSAKTIGENLSTWRKMRSLTTQQMAEKANVTRATISRLENGDPSVSFSTVLNVCNALDITDMLVAATDPYETDFGRLRADQELPKRIRRQP